MSEKYGPQTYQIEKVLEQIKNLTPDEIKKLTMTRTEALDDARNSALGAFRGGFRTETWSATWSATWYATRYASWSVARTMEWNVNLIHIWYKAWNDAWVIIRDVAWDTTSALLVRDLIGDKFTQAHYDLLTKSWRDVIGEFEEPTKGGNNGRD